MNRPVALSCPLCGGTVGPPLGTRVTRCDFCSRPLYYSAKDFAPRLALRPTLDEDAIRGRCRALFESPWVPRGLARTATLLKKRRTYLPFYLLTGKRGGVLATGKERLVPRQSAFTMTVDVQVLGSPENASARYLGSRPEVVVEEDSRVVLGDFRYVYSAAALENWDLLDTDLRDVVTGHVDSAEPASLSELAKSGDVVDVDIPMERVVERGVAPTPTAGGELTVLEMQTVLVYLPVLTLTFRLGDHVFSVTLEECEGRWVAGRLPFRRGWALLAGLPLVASLGFVVGKLGKAVMQVSLGEWVRSPGTLQVFLVFGILAAGIIVFGLQGAWMLLRTPYVVRVSPGGPRIEAAGEAPPSPLGPLTNLYAALFRQILEGQKKAWWD